MDVMPVAIEGEACEITHSTARSGNTTCQSDPSAWWLAAMMHDKVIGKLTEQCTLYRYGKQD